MRSYLRAGTVAVLASLCLLSAPVASAYDTAGNPCVGDGLEPDSTAIGFANQSPTTPFMPSQILLNGVVTRWRVEAAPGVGPLLQQLVVVEQTPEESARKIGQSGLETVVAGSNEFATRIPVSQFSLVGLQGPVATLFCDEEPLHTAGVIKGPYGLNEARHYDVRVNFGVPAIAIVEPDADADGYGDQTQDECPWLATAHEACASVRIAAVTRVTRQAIELDVSTGSPTSLTVSGSIRWKRAKPSHGHAGSSAKARWAAARLQDAAAEVPFEGTTTLSLRLPATAKRRLAELPRGRGIPATLDLAATDRAGRTTTAALTVKLPGRKLRRR